MDIKEGVFAVGETLLLAHPAAPGRVPLKPDDTLASLGADRTTQNHEYLHVCWGFHKLGGARGGTEITLEGKTKLWPRPWED